MGRGDYDAAARPEQSLTGLLSTTGSWLGLPQHMRALMEDAMAHVDEPNFPVVVSVQSTASTAGMAFPGGVHRRLEARERTYLDDAQVIHIFLAKRTIKPGRRSGLATALSQEYGVTSKAIRDIWKLR